jgi:hypothetical protein
VVEPARPAHTHFLAVVVTVATSQHVGSVELGSYALHERAGTYDGEALIGEADLAVGADVADEARGDSMPSRPLSTRTSSGRRQRSCVAAPSASWLL